MESCFSVSINFFGLLSSWMPKKKINLWSFIRIGGKFLVNCLTWSLFNWIKSSKLETIWLIKGYRAPLESLLLSQQILNGLLVAGGFCIEGKALMWDLAWACLFFYPRRGKGSGKKEEGTENQHCALNEFVLRNITFRKENL